MSHARPGEPGLCAGNSLSKSFFAQTTAACSSHAVDSLAFAPIASNVLVIY